MCIQKVSLIFSQSISQSVSVRDRIISVLNEQLVHLLIERDTQHMEQDSMLVDIEDMLQFVKNASCYNNIINNND